MERPCSVPALHRFTNLCLVTQSCLILCDPMDCSPLGSSVHGILQARILEWIAMSSSRGSSQPRDRTQVSCIAGGFFTIWATREGQSQVSCSQCPGVHVLPPRPVNALIPVLLSLLSPSNSSSHPTSSRKPSNYVCFHLHIPLHEFFSLLSTPVRVRALDFPM